ncbi:MAG: type I methionyl aminopeptidase [Deltaproteobacteria bacterium]|nr:type I methionyl aminopeptidase [Deltaproteobacteria bacterium]
MENQPQPLVPPQRLPRPNEHCWCGSGKKYKRCHQSADQGAPRLAAAPVTAKRPPARPIKAGRVSPRRTVPPHIPRPEYALSGRPGDKAVDEIMTGDRLERMRRACHAAAQVLRTVGAMVRPGVTTDEIDAVAHEEYIRLGGFPSTLNYHGFPKSLCTSVNEVICHGIPDDRPLEDGDIINLDVTIYLEGMHGDCSATYLVGHVEEQSRRLVQVTHECMMLGIAAAKPGRPVSDIGRVIEAHADKHGYGVVRAYCGHGIGERFHTSLQVPHYFEPSSHRRLVPGMTFTIEPMVTLGTWDHRIWGDGWTAVTADLQRTAQFEHTVLLTERGAEILTVLPGEKP